MTASRPGGSTLLLGFSFAILAQFAIAQELKNSVETS
jgi:hypothetical protein